MADFLPGYMEDSSDNLDVKQKIEETINKIAFHEDELKRLHVQLNDLYAQVRGEDDPVIPRKPRDLSYYSAHLHRTLPKPPSSDRGTMPRSATSNLSNLYSASMTNLKDIDNSDTFSLKSFNKFSTIDVKFFKRFIRRSRALESDSEEFSKGSPNPSLDELDRLGRSEEVDADGEIAISFHL
eukprot:sb/3471571/